MPLHRQSAGPAFALALAMLGRHASAAESIEFVSEHLPEIAMDNRYAALPLWESCASGSDPSDAACWDLGIAYQRTHGGTLSLDGPMFSTAYHHALSERLRITGFVFYDRFSMRSGVVERRPLDILFANPPLTLPVDASFTGLDGTLTDIGAGMALNGAANWRILPAFEWSVGLMWQRVDSSDARLDYRIDGGPDAGVAGTVDYSATYTEFSPFVGAAWPRIRGAWRFNPHVQVAMPMPPRGFAGRITGPGFDLAGDQSANGHGKHFGDPSLTLGFDVTYLPWDLTVDLGSVVSQSLLEPQFHEGMQHNLLLSTYCTF